MNIFSGNIARKIAATFFLLSCLGVMQNGVAQSPPPLANPNLQLSTFGSVSAVVRLSDGSTVFGGRFTSVNGVARSSIAKLRPNGTLDPDWNPPGGGNINALAVDASDNVFVGGNFNPAGGSVRQAIAKLAGSGTGAIDAGWNPSADAQVMALVVDSAGNVYAGGYFANIGGQARSGLAKLSGSGAGVVDANWNPAPVGGAVWSLALDSAGNVFVGGDFSTIGGQARTRIAKLSGSSGAADANWNPSANGTVDALIADSAGSVYAGGVFSSIGGLTRYGIARLSASGSGATDTSWVPAGGGSVQALALDGSGNVYVGGSFSQFGSLPRNAIARILSSGSIDAAWDPSPTLASSSAVTVRALVLDASGGNVIAAGDFNTLGGQQHFGLGKVSAAGAVSVAMTDAETSTGTQVNAIVAQPNGGTIVAGTFLKAGGLLRGNLLRLQADGTLDPNWNPSIDNVVYALAVDSNGDVYAGGNFTSVNGQSRSAIAKLSGAGTGVLDASWNPSANGSIRALAVDGSNNIFAGGLYSTIGGKSRANIAKLSSTGIGAVDATWNASANGNVRALAVDAGGNVYAGGYFTTIGGQAHQYIAKLSGVGAGSADASWNPSPGNYVFALAIDSGNVYAGGLFASVSGQSRAYLAKLATATGALDAAWNPSASDAVYALTIGTGGAVYVGGAFTTIGAQPRGYLAKLTGVVGSPDANWNASSNGPVYALARDGSGNVYAGGLFSAIGTSGRSNLAALPANLPTTTGITSAATSVVGQSVTISVSVAAASGTPDGTISVSDDAATTHSCGPAILSSGSATCTISWTTPGTYQLTASYSPGGGGSYAASISTAVAHVVNRGATAVSVTPASGSVNLGSSVSVNVAVAALSPAAGIPSGAVSISDGSTSCSIASLDGSGAGSCQLTPISAGNKPLTATYAGDANFLGSNGTNNLAVITYFITASVIGGNGTVAVTTPTVNYGGTASFNIAPATGYHVASVSGDTCSPAGSSAGGVWVATNITANCAVLATFALNPIAALAINVSDNRDYARFGILLSYIVTLSNTGTADANGLTLSNTLPLQIDSVNTSWICVGAGNGAVCPATGIGDLNTSGIALPAGRSLSWQVTAPVLQQASGDTIDYSVSANWSGGSAVSATDTNTLVIFRDGFNVTNTDGTQDNDPQPAFVTCNTNENFGIFDDKSLQVFVIPNIATRTPIETMFVAQGNNGLGFRIERMDLESTQRLRIVTVAHDGSERASGWAITTVGAQWALVTGQVEGGGRTLLLAGDAESIKMTLPAAIANTLPLRALAATSKSCQ